MRDIITLTIQRPGQTRSGEICTFDGVPSDIYIRKDDRVCFWFFFYFQPSLLASCCASPPGLKINVYIFVYRTCTSCSWQRDFTLRTTGSKPTSTSRGIQFRRGKKEDEIYNPFGNATSREVSTALFGGVWSRMPPSWTSTKLRVLCVCGWRRRAKPSSLALRCGTKGEQLQSMHKQEMIWF